LNWDYTAAVTSAPRNVSMEWEWNEADDRAGKDEVSFAGARYIEAIIGIYDVM
jgi:hypothetical protein